MIKNIVMIHGMWGGSWAWDNYKSFFEDKGYTCYTPELRYHDISPNDKPDPALGTTSLLDYAQDLKEYISNLDDEPVIVGQGDGLSWIDDAINNVCLIKGEGDTRRDS